MSKKNPPAKKHFGFNQIYDSLNMQWVPIWTHSEQESATPTGMPSDITIFGQRYRVKYRKEIYSAPKKTAKLAGIVVFSHRLILIDPDQTLHEMRQVLYHEAAHVYLKEQAQKDNRLRKITDAEIEGVCDLFGEAIVDLAQNNPLPR